MVDAQIFVAVPGSFRQGYAGGTDSGIGEEPVAGASGMHTGYGILNSLIVVDISKLFAEQTNPINGIDRSTASG